MTKSLLLPAIGLIAACCAARAAEPGELGDDGRPYVPSSEHRAVYLANVASAGSPAVAIVASAGGDVGSPFYTDVSDRLVASGLFSSVTVFDAGTVTPSLAELAPFSAVLVWSNFSFADAAALGEQLSRYVDGGGGVVIASFANSSDTAGRALGGRWSTNDYELIPAASGTSTGAASLGTVLQPGHPLVVGFASFAGGTSSFRPATTSLHPAGTLVATWDDGSTLVSTREDAVGARVDLGFYPPSDTVLPGYWDATTDGGVLLVNAVDYAANRAPLAPGDTNGDGEVDEVDLAAIDTCQSIADSGGAPAGCITFDFDRDDDVDCFDQVALRGVWTGLTPPPPLSSACQAVVPTTSQWGLICLGIALLTGASMLLRKPAFG